VVGEALHGGAQLGELLDGGPHLRFVQGAGVQPIGRFVDGGGQPRAHMFGLVIEPLVRHRTHRAHRLRVVRLGSEIAALGDELPRLLATTSLCRFDPAVLGQHAQVERATRHAVAGAGGAFGGSRRPVPEQLQQRQPQGVGERPDAVRVGDGDAARIIGHAADRRTSRTLAQRIFSIPRDRLPKDAG
jgi:hypothetical protein